MKSPLTLRFPLQMTTKVASYVIKKKLAKTKRFPMVLMLEPLHACNLTCTGCGRIREYESTIKQKLSIQECLDAVDECGAPVVSICGGEPMIYPGIGELVAKILERKKPVYLCTNGMFIRKKIAEFKPSRRFFFNVHLDGMKTIARHRRGARGRLRRRDRRHQGRQGGRATSSAPTPRSSRRPTWPSSTSCSPT